MHPQRYTLPLPKLELLRLAIDDVDANHGDLVDLDFAIARLIDKEWEAATLDRIAHPRRLFLALHEFDTGVGGDGLWHVLQHYAPLVPIALEACRSLDFPHAASILERTIALFPDPHILNDTDAAEEELFRNEDRYSAAFNPLESEFFSLLPPEPYAERRLRLALDRSDLFFHAS